MKTAGRENQKRYTSVVASRAPGTEGQNKPARWDGLDGKKNSGHRRSVFSLTPFTELTRQVELLPESPSFVLQSPEPKVTLTPLFVGPRSEQLQ
jgi:hypothetical protein